MWSRAQPLFTRTRVRGGKESGEVPIRSVNYDVMLVVYDVFNVAM